MKQLVGRRIVLTGASRGIGREAVQLFCAEGAEIIGVARHEARLQELARQFPNFLPLVGDITDRGLGARVASAVQQRWGALDVLVNNAAIQNFNAGFHAEPLDTLERNFLTNVISVHWLTSALLPL
jgi:NAD(P)-dependent dehydrogenase (short-subunit alcohol dehydrogenase family)